MPDEPIIEERHLYTWRVDGPTRGACGVTDRLGTADRRFRDALDAIPDGTGSIRVARLDLLANPPGYAYGRTVARARRGGVTTAILGREEVREP